MTQSQQDQPEKKEDGFFDVREAKSLEDLYARMKVIDETGENVDWRSMDPREYLSDDDGNYPDELDEDRDAEEPDVRRKTG